MAKKATKRNSPKTKLRFVELLGDLSITALAKTMGVTYTQLYPYKKPGANPTLLFLEKMAKGLSELKGEPIYIADLIADGRPKERRK